MNLWFIWIYNARFPATMIAITNSTVAWMNPPASELELPPASTAA